LLIAFAFLASLHHIPPMNPVWEFAGVENYQALLNSDRFWGSMWRGAIYTLGSTVLQTGVGIWMAPVLNKNSRGQRLLTSVVFTAYLIPTTDAGSGRNRVLHRESVHRANKAIDDSEILLITVTANANHLSCVPSKILDVQNP
jgi:ABC-type sugar transport system permease subunit